MRARSPCSTFFSINRRQILTEHAGKHLAVDLHENDDVIEAIHLARRSVFVESKFDRADPADRHASELYRRAHVHPLDGAIHICLDIDARTKHLAGAESDEPRRENRQRDDDEESDAEITWLLAHSASRRKKLANVRILRVIAQILRTSLGDDPFFAFVEHDDAIGHGIDTWPTRG